MPDPIEAPAAPDPLDLASTLKLERLEVNLFRGVSPRDEGPRIFGGHVIAQSLLAAYGTVEGKACHSLHAYFMRPGDPAVPIVFEVDRSRDGGSFDTRRVIAIQHGEQIFNMAASFQRSEAGLEHQVPMPAAPDPESVPDERSLVLAAGDAASAGRRRFADRPRAIDLRWPDPQPVGRPPEKKPPHKQVWLRAVREIGEDVAMQQAILAYASDMAFMETALRVHGLIWTTPGLQVASLDHALWFHRPFDLHHWHLYDQDSPSTSGGRGLVRGAMYSQDGTLVASMAQDCLMRVRPAERSSV